MNLERKDFIRYLGAGGLAIAAPGLLQAMDRKPAKRPNILFVMSDDHATSAISAYGGWLAESFKTPNIDRLASEGMRLNNVFCTNSICTPSRASILTGMYSHKNGVFTLRDDLDRNRDNVAKQLQKAGYATAMIGKWHLHTEPSGFDYYNVLPGQGLYHDPLLKEKSKPWEYHNKGGEVYPGYVTDVITDQALKWLDSRDQDQPFFMMLHHKAPHGLWEYASRHENLFGDADLPEPENLFEDKSHRSPASRHYGRDMAQMATRMDGTFKPNKPEWPTGKLDTDGLTDIEKQKAAYQKYIKDYLRCVKAVDENIGRVLDYLDQAGLTEDTVVIYSSDQGMLLGEHNNYDKRWMFEESLKMPFVIRYPQEIKAGSVGNDMALNIDFAALFLDYADVAIPESMQGESFRANLNGKTPADWRKSVYYRYWMHVEQANVPAHFGIRTDRYKLIFYYGLALGMKGATEGWETGAGWELYDLQNDPTEVNNVYKDSEYEDVVKELKMELAQLRFEAGEDDSLYPDLEKRIAENW